MAALAADINVSSIGPVVTIQMPAIADTFYQGAFVYILDAGGNVSPVPVTTSICLGLSPTQQVVGTAGDLIQVAIQGYFWMPVGTNIAAEDEGNLLMMDVSGTLSDNPADLVSVAPGDVAIAATDIIVGRLIRVSSPNMLVAVNFGGVTGFTGAADATIIALV